MVLPMIATTQTPQRAEREEKVAQLKQTEHTPVAEAVAVQDMEEVAVAQRELWGHMVAQGAVVLVMSRPQRLI